MKKTVLAIIVVLLLVTGFNLPDAHANNNQQVNDYLAAYGLPPDTTRDEFLEHLVLNSKLKPWEEELGVDAGRDDICYYLYTNNILPGDLGLEVDEDFADWDVRFYLPLPVQFKTEIMDSNQFRPYFTMLDLTAIYYFITGSLPFLAENAMTFYNDIKPGEVYAPELAAEVEPKSTPVSEPRPEPEKDTCAYEGCDRPTFLDSPYCLEHELEYGKSRSDSGCAGGG